MYDKQLRALVCGEYVEYVFLTLSVRGPSLDDPPVERISNI